MNVSIKDAKNRLTELTRRVEKGETVTITRNGEPVADLVPHQRKGGLDWEALRDYKKKRGIANFVKTIPADFDEPLAEDFLITPLPNP
ncbi:MAG: type II toxin-antitoxin system Phd/YefM family antitoxin [Rhizobiales bacterium]|nr:type II toxin-antitoxin system Phd/YefM family antitoxin [Hyphomicrobiales bacterium]